MKNNPASITANRNEKILSIQWKDQHRSDYGFTLLRYACPCVECKGGHEYMSDRPDPKIFSMPPEDAEKTQIQNVVSVGSYAISIEWEDGHQYGIYNWDFLRALCPCNDCRLE